MQNTLRFVMINNIQSPKNIRQVFSVLSGVLIEKQVFTKAVFPGTIPIT